MGRGCAAGKRAPHSSDDAEEFHHPAGPKELKLYALYMKKKSCKRQVNDYHAMFCSMQQWETSHLMTPSDQEAICKMAPLV